jgi:hypothetical protein
MRAIMIEKFTDKFLHIPIELVNTITGSDQVLPASEKIDPLKITAYREACADMDAEINGTTIYFDNGTIIYTPLMLHDFEDVLNKWADRRQSIWNKPRQS